MFKPASDEEYVDRLRRVVARHDRWRPWLVGFYAALLVAYVGVAVLAAYTTDMIRQLAGARRHVWMGFTIGATLGGIVFLGAVKVFHGLTTALFGVRTERLLLVYHDALAELARPSQPAILNR